MSEVVEQREYRRSECVVFKKTKEDFGGLSNMAPGFPLLVNDVQIRTSEALYQACRFPDLPDVQRLIISQGSPMTAKMRGKPHQERTRSDWNRVRVGIMRWCLRVKLVQNWHKFTDLLLATELRPIVEESNKDEFWAAKPVDSETLVGRNVLGRLLMELREGLLAPDIERPKCVTPPGIARFLLYGEAIRDVQARDSSPKQRSDLFSQPVPGAVAMSHDWLSVSTPRSEDLLEYVQQWCPPADRGEEYYHRELRGRLEQFAALGATSARPTVMSADPDVQSAQVTPEPVRSQPAVDPYRQLSEGDSSGRCMKPDLTIGRSGIELKTVPFADQGEFCRALGQVWLYMCTGELDCLTVLLFGRRLPEHQKNALAELMSLHPSRSIECHLIYWNGQQWCNLLEGRYAYDEDGFNAIPE